MSSISAWRASIIALLVCGAPTLFAAVATAAEPARGTLTQTEYNVLSRTLPAVKESLFGKRFDLTLGGSSCRADGSSTALMSGERMACADEVAMFQQFQTTDVSVQRCDALYPTTSTSTTNTTTSSTAATTTTTTTTSGVDGFSSNQLLTAVCEDPEYRRLTRYVDSIYTSASELRRRALQRGFTGACVDALGASSDLIADERRFASTTKQISLDVATLAYLNSGASPAHVPNASELTRNALAFELALATYVRQAKPRQTLSACQHR
jgi:hypothetical protein